MPLRHGPTQQDRNGSAKRTEWTQIPATENKTLEAVTFKKRSLGIEKMEKLHVKN